MSQQRHIKEVKKKPVLTPKEKKQAKQQKKHGADANPLIKQPTS
jgi:hypothetical protein